MNRTSLFHGGFLLVLLIVGCSSTGSPVVPVDDNTLSPQSAVRPAQTHLWGFYDVFLESGAGELTIVLNRNAMFTANVVTFLNGSGSNLQLANMDANTATGYIDIGVDVGLRHPFSNMHQYDGYDVRGVFMGNGSDTLEYNPDLQVAVQGTDQFMFPDPDDGTGGPDGYTRWYNPSEFPTEGILGYTKGNAATPAYKASATLCPYRYFADGLGVNEDLWGFLQTNSADHGVFSSGSLNWRRYYMRFPTPSPGVKFNYAVLANWEDVDIHPSNAPEPVACKVIDTSDLYYVSPTVNGGNLKLDISLWDWDAKLDPSGAMKDYNIFIESTVLGVVHEFTTEEMTPVDGTEDYSTYHVEIAADAVSSDTGNEYWVIVEEQDADYTNEFGISNSAGTDPLAAFFKYNLTVEDEMIQVLSPNGGEQWAPGSTHQIQWTSHGLTGNVKLEYSKDGFQSDVHIIAPDQINDGGYMWQNIPYDPSQVVKVRITSITSPGTWDISDGNFTITGPSISVLEPNGGESWVVGSSHDIKWSYQNLSGTVKIEYSKDDFVSDTQLIAAGQTNDGIYTWNPIPFDPSTTVRVKVSSTDYPSIYDISDSDFTIAKQITVTSPNGGESWAPGTKHMVTWTSQGLSGNVDIGYSIDDFAHVIWYMFNESNDGSWEWTIPNNPSSTAKVRVRSTNYPTIYDDSDGFFTIPHYIKLISPIGGETWSIGSDHAILWESVYSSDKVVIEYSKDNFSADIHTVATNEDNDGEYWWIDVPNDPSTTVKIRVSYASDPASNDVSPDNFSIGSYNTSGWALTWGGTGNDQPGGIAIDQNADVYVAGCFNSPEIDLDPGPGDLNTAKYGGDDCYLSKFHPNGDLVWALHWSGSGSEYACAVTFDQLGYVYVTGFFQGTVDFDPGPGTDSHSSQGVDAYLTKFSSSGVYQWVRIWGGDFVDSGDMAFDNSGSVLIFGDFTNTVDFDPGPGTDYHTSNGGYDTYVSKIDSSGNYQWASTWGGPEYDFSNGDVTADSLSNVFVCSSPDSDVNIRDADLRKFSPDGDLLWNCQWGGSEDDLATGIAIDSSDNLYVSGSYQGTVDFDPGPGTENHSTPNPAIPNAYLSKFSSSGFFQWVRVWGNNDTRAHDIAFDSSQGIFATGFFEGTVDFDPGPGIDSHTSNGFGDAYVSKFDLDGNYYWVRTWGSSNSAYRDIGMGIAADSQSIFVAGRFPAIAQFAPTGSPCYEGTDNHLCRGDLNTFLTRHMSDGCW